MINSKDLRIGSWVYDPINKRNCRIVALRAGYQNPPIVDNNGNGEPESSLSSCDYLNPIPLSEEILVNKCGYSIITESSAGIRYGIVKDHVFNSDLTLTFWKTTDNAGKFFRGNIEIDSVHILQNLLWALAKIEITL